MWFKLFICTTDTIYAKRLAGLLDRKYGDKTEVSIFSDIDHLSEYIGEHSVDILLFGEEFEKEASPERWSCPCAILVNQLYEDTEQGIKKIARFQRGDKLFHEILELYSDGGKVKLIHTASQGGNQGKIYVFAAAAGGVGTSTVAKAYAKKCAVYEKVLYLNFSMLNDQRNNEGQNRGLSDILIALKSRRDILSIKLMSSVMETEDRFYTYAACKNPLELYEMDEENMENLIIKMKALDEYQKIIIDIGTELGKTALVLYRMADQLVYIRGKSFVEERKFRRLCEIFQYLEEKEQFHLFRKMLVYRNKTVKKELTDYQDWNIREVGWIPDLQMEDENAIIARIAQSDVFDDMENQYEA